MSLKGTFSVFPTRALTRDEMMECESYARFSLSPESDTWDPYNPTWAEQEASFLDHEGELVSGAQSHKTSMISTEDTEIAALQTGNASQRDVDHQIDAVIASD